MAYRYMNQTISIDRKELTIPQELINIVIDFNEHEIPSAEFYVIHKHPFQYDYEKFPMTIKQVDSSNPKKVKKIVEKINQATIILGLTLSLEHMDKILRLHVLLSFLISIIAPVMALTIFIFQEIVCQEKNLIVLAIQIIMSLHFIYVQLYIKHTHCVLHSSLGELVRRIKQDTLLMYIIGSGFIAMTMIY